ncbi:MAG: hypothetical protein KY468_05370 [Armatimonadetes bacterium]|nr:hypothetical protein [Armatimonadota bacterium]
MLTELAGLARGDHDRDRAVKAHLLNVVSGNGATTVGAGTVEIATHIERTRVIYAAYPEIPRGPVFPQEVRSDSPSVMAVAYGSTLDLVIATVNLSPEPVQAVLWVPGMGSLLYDRLEEQHVPLAGGLAWMELPGYAQAAYELR